MDNKRVRIGTLYLPSGFESMMQEITLRLTRDPRFVETHKERLTPQMKVVLIKALQEMLGPGVKDIKLTFSLRAGCSCPCSPGFCISGVPTGKAGEYSWQRGMDDWHRHPLLAPAARDYPGRERAVFYLDEHGVLDGRTSEVYWPSRRGPGRAPRRDYQHTSVMSFLPFGKRVTPVKTPAA